MHGRGRNTKHASGTSIPREQRAASPPTRAPRVTMVAALPCRLVGRLCPEGVLRVRPSPSHISSLRHSFFLASLPQHSLRSNRAAAMVWFYCDDCGDSIKKVRLWLKDWPRRPARLGENARGLHVPWARSDGHPARCTALPPSTAEAGEPLPRLRRPALHLHRLQRKLRQGGRQGGCWAGCRLPA